MKNFIQIVMILFVNLFALGAGAQAMNDASTDKALSDTVDLLKSEEQRNELFKKDQKAKGANDQVHSLTRGNKAQTQEIYNISADIMGPLMQSVGNDPTKAMELLQKAQSNPEAFYKSLPEDVRNKIRAVSSQIEQGSPRGNPSP